MNTGSIHHIEFNVSDLAKTRKFWSWLLEKLGYELYQNWLYGFSYRLGDTYIVFVQTKPEFLTPPFHRCRTGINHIAFYLANLSVFQEIEAECEIKKIPILYKEKRLEPNVLFLEDPDRLKVELRFIELVSFPDERNFLSLSKEQLFTLADFIVSLKDYKPDKSKEILISALHKDINPILIYEAILQCYLFYGFPSAIEGVRILSEFTTLNLELLNNNIETNIKYLLAKGEVICQQVYSDYYPLLIKTFRNYSPELTNWMLYEGYGKVLGRPYLKLSDREFLNVVMLSQTSFIKQFQAHLNGCKNTGFSIDWLNEWLLNNRYRISDKIWITFMKFIEELPNY